MSFLYISYFAIKTCIVLLETRLTKLTGIAWDYVQVYGYLQLNSSAIWLRLLPLSCKIAFSNELLTVFLRMPQFLLNKLLAPQNCFWLLIIVYNWIRYNNGPLRMRKWIKIKSEIWVTFICAEIQNIYPVFAINTV